MIYPLNAPLLDFLLLAIIEKQDSYGYQISQQIKDVSSIKDSTLYPILKKLSDNGYVNTYDQSFQGRNRKYYSITDSGRSQRNFLNLEWKNFTAAIDDILKNQQQEQTGGDESE